MNHVNGTSSILAPGGIKTPDCDFLGATRSLSASALSSQVCTFIFNKSLSLPCVCLALEFFLAQRREPRHRCSGLSPLLNIPERPGDISTVLHSHHLCTRVPVSSHPYQHLLLTVLFCFDFYSGRPNGCEIAHR